MHQNFKSANVLLNTELEVRVSDCGFGLLLSSGSAAQVWSLSLATITILENKHSLIDMLNGLKQYVIEEKRREDERGNYN